MQAVGLVSFSESAILPIPIDAVIIPVMLADRSKVWPVAWLATWTSVLGGAVGYALGWLLYETVVAWLIDFYGWQEAFAEVQQDFHEQGALIVAIGAITPVPYKLVAIASGVEQLDFALFMLVSVVGRAARFVFFSGLVWYFGPAVRRIMDRNAKWVGWVVLATLVLGFVIVGWLV
ncbi:MAG TPA: VTT domain-containing protein [Kiloniellales bacterium]|nr:VTT domain-containing protein [Kiloniellales bacterium]